MIWETTIWIESIAVSADGFEWDLCIEWKGTLRGCEVITVNVNIVDLDFTSTFGQGSRTTVCDMSEITAILVELERHYSTPTFFALSEYSRFFIYHH